MKTSSVHFQLAVVDIVAIKQSADVPPGIYHDHYRHEVMLATVVRALLAADLNG